MNDHRANDMQAGHVIINGNRCSTGRFSRAKTPAFTLVEIIVSLTITSICLLGVYEIVQNAVATEQAIGIRSRDYMRASGVADQVEKSFARIVILPDIKAVDAGSDDEGNRYALMVVGPTGGQMSERVKYRWNSSDSDSGATWQLEKVSWRMAGSKIIVAGAPAEGESMTDESGKVLLIGKNMAEFSIQFADGAKSPGAWGDVWPEDSQRPLVRVHVKIGDESVDRVFQSHAQAAFTE